MNKPIIIMLLLLSALHGHLIKGQRIENVQTKLDAGNIVLVFDLIPRESTEELYNIVITSSKDHYNASLKLLKGTTENVKPADGLTYLIDGKENFTGYRGKIHFEVKAEMVFSPIRFSTIHSNTVVKRGKTITFSWQGGLENDVYSIELYQEDAKVSSLASEISDTSMVWDVPKKYRPGDHYQIKISSQSHPRQTAVSPAFQIKRKIPLLAQLVPFVATAAVYVILSADPGEPPTGSTKVKLPDPPEPPID